MDNIIHYIKNTCDGKIYSNIKYKYEIEYIHCTSPYINKFETLSVILGKSHYIVHIIRGYEEVIKSAVFPRSGNMKDLKLYIASYLCPSQT